MEKNGKAVAAAILLGVFLPQFLLPVVTAMFPKKGALPQPTRPSEEQVQQTEPLQPELRIYIPVVGAQGDITVMNLEEYVLAVVLAEMPAYFHEEALKAQAVVARTYALRRIAKGDKHPNGAVCTYSGCCQAFMTEEAYLEKKRGSLEDAEKIKSAVLATEGQVLCYNGKLAESTYFSCSGGRTENAVEVWGAEYPYLQSVESPGEEGAATYRAEKSFGIKELEEKLEVRLEGSPKQWLGEVIYTQGGGVKTIALGGKVFTGAKVRKLLGLNSICFTLIPGKDGVVFETAGWGHRVGMSQHGANAMGKLGSSYRHILSYYYPGTEIDKAGNFG